MLKWTVPNENGIPILTMPNVAMPLHGLAPRTIIGASKWKIERAKCYMKADYTCEICGRELGTGKCDAHELYDVYYDKHYSKFVRLLCLCKECVDADTEVLTPKGWVKISGITTNDKVACWDKTGKITFLQPTDTIKSYHKKAIHMKYKKQDLYFSPNHRLLVQVASKQSSSFGTYKDILAKEYKPTHYYNWIAAGSNPKKESLTSLERLFIAIEADGTLVYDKEHPRGHQARERKRSSKYNSEQFRYTFSIRLKKKRKQERFQLLLDESEVKYNTIKSKDGYMDWTVWLNDNPKTFSNCFDYEMGENKAREFLKELVKWDGNYYKSNYAWYSNKKQEMDFVQAVACQAGVRTSINCVDRIGKIRKGKYNTPFTKLSYAMCFHNKKPIYSGKVFTVLEEDFNDYMYCLEVPTTYFLARKGDMIFVTGNCHQACHSGRNLALYTQGDKYTTKKYMLELAERTFKLVHQWNMQNIEKEPLKLCDTWLEWAKHPDLKKDIETYIDRYEIEFYEQPVDSWNEESWGKWYLEYNEEKYPTPYKTMEEWRERYEN